MHMRLRTPAATEIVLNMGPVPPHSSKRKG